MRKFKVGDTVKVIDSHKDDCSGFKIGHEFMVVEINKGDAFDWLRAVVNRAQGIPEMCCELVTAKEEIINQYELY